MTENVKDLGAKALADLEETPKPPKAAKAPEPAPEPTPEDAEAIRASRKAKISQILTRGMLNMKLEQVTAACVPPDRRSKFVRDDEDSVIRYKALEFDFVYTEEAQSLVGPDGRIRVGDLVLMTVAADQSVLLKEVRTEQLKRNMEYGRRDYQERMGQAGLSVLDRSKVTIGK